MSELTRRQASVLRGAAAGSLATVAMSAVMLAAGRAGLMGRQPPEAIVRQVGEHVGAEPRGRSADVLASVAHVAFGAGAGVVFAQLPARRARVPQAVLGSLGIYLTAYQGWVPALGALPSASHDRDDRQAVMIAAHVVFGVVLARLDRRWRGLDRG